LTPLREATDAVGEMLIGAKPHTPSRRCHASMTMTKTHAHYSVEALRAPTGKAAEQLGAATSGIARILESSERGREA